MDTITIMLLVSTSVLGILALFFLARWLGLRKELRQFTEQINEIRTTDREQPIKVASFGAPSVELAREINLLVKELRDAASRSADEEQRVRTIMAGVSHDFRTPLTAADGYLQMVRDSLESMPPDEAERIHELTEIRDYLSIVTERLRYLKTLSDEFFEVTYLDAKKDLPLEHVRFDIVLSEVMMAQYSWIEASGIEPKLSIPEEQLTVQADRHYLERILENLFSNVRKYAKSRIELSVQRKDDSIIFRLGNDVDESFTIDVEHIFEPFYRAKDRSGPGTGLGLYVVKELAAAMHFQIEGTTEGAFFEICLRMPI